MGLADDVTETWDGEEGTEDGEDQAVVPEEGVYADSDEGAEDGACGRVDGREGQLSAVSRTVLPRAYSPTSLCKLIWLLCPTVGLITTMKLTSAHCP